MIPPETDSEHHYLNIVNFPPFGVEAQNPVMADVELKIIEYLLLRSELFFEIL
jgi:hypothetical protein